MVNWNAEKDQIILKGIFKFHDIKSSAPLLKYLAEQIGEDCTPKAVSHRLNNIRNHGKPLPNSASAGNTPEKVATTPKTPRSRAKATPKKAAPIETESDDGGPEGFLDSPSARRSSKKRKMKAPTYAETDNSGDEIEEEYLPFNKRVKVEPVEEEVQFGGEEM